ncbi:ribonuclease P protein component [Salinisphaera sp. USBA-960]|uniref:ribonuclease P protein component n=1 Tax=Salinisphaera orenii TaxID=856731 RepID=UPI000DBE98FF|nr:ribonuclease P protein component [Salifodinibacter halophilus]NNC27078.1 ribonuclease P protein component [Salifodinibacter halophilus]
MKAAAFPRRRRLTTGRDYRRVFAERDRIPGRFFVLALAPGTDARLGLAVGKRYCRRAVDRNRVKRVAREWFRRRLVYLDGLEIVCSVRRGVTTASNDALYADLERLGRRAVQRAGAGSAARQDA